MARTAALVLAGGSGTRTGWRDNKVLVPIAGRSPLQRSLTTLAAVRAVDDVVIVVRAHDRDAVVAAEMSTPKVRAIVAGGGTRHASEWAGLQAVAPAIAADEIDLVLIHDAARPFARPELITTLVTTARAVGGAVPGLTVEAGVFHCGADRVAPTPVPVDDLRRVQTPQAFRAAPLLGAYRAAAGSGFDGVDTAACVERFAPDLRVVVIPGDPDNIKVTVAFDLAAAEAIARRRDRTGP